MSSLRVLYVLKRYPQLSQTFVVRELLELEATGVTIGVDALGRTGDGPRHDDVDHVQATVRHLPRRPRLRDREARTAHARLAARRPLIWLRHAHQARGEDWRRFVQAGLVADRIRREDFDHVHAHFASAASEVARDAAALAGISYSVTAHARDIFTAQHAPLLSARLGGAAAVVTVSEHNRRHLETVLPGTVVVHVPNGVAVTPPRLPRAGGPVLCVARLVDKKGIDTLIRALGYLASTHPEICVEVVGDGDRLSELTALAASLGVTDRLTFLGALDSIGVDAAYERCSMLTLPCRVTPDGDRDGLPTVIVEAMARSIPVISTDIVGIPEVVQDGVTGLVIEPDDPLALADRIVALWSDPERAAALGAAGRRIVAERFDPSRSAQLLSRVFVAAGNQP